MTRDRPPRAAREPGEADELWRALSSPWRRMLLDELRAGPRTTGELAAATPDLSRFAVMQHLEVLVEAGLVLVRRRGRQRFNHLNPVPLRRVYDRWVSRFAADAAGELLALERHLTTERKGEGMSETTTVEQVRVVRLEAELTFRTTAERLFRAMTAETLEWFPHTYGGERVQAVVIEPRVGGLVYEDWGEGTGHMYGWVTFWDPPHSVSMRTRLGPGTIMDGTFTILERDDRCTLEVSRVVVGPLSEQDVEGIRVFGDLNRFEDAIRAVVEAA